MGTLSIVAYSYRSIQDSIDESDVSNLNKHMVRNTPRRDLKQHTDLFIHGRKIKPHSEAGGLVYDLTASSGDASILKI